MLDKLDWERPKLALGRLPANRCFRPAFQPLHRMNPFRALACTVFIACCPVRAALPWEREQPLKEAARTVTIAGMLDALQPAQGANLGRNTLSNEQVRAALWGPSNRVTLSLLKTDVWDRRYGIEPTVTLEEIRAGVYSPANKGFDDMPPNHRRPVRGYLKPEGGRVDPYECWNAYPFPCEKPVGQIVLGLDELAGVPNPPLAQSCADGTMRVALKNDRASADVQVLLSMTRNVFAVRGRITGVAAPWLRVYRHIDQAFRRYMTEDQRGFRPRTPGAASGAIAAEPGPTQVPFDYARDAAWNGPVAPPESGTDGKYFWIHQRLPAEKTFPQGFDYVLMGLVGGGAKPKIETKDHARDLGTPPTGVRGEAQSRLEDGYKVIREAPGSAATALLTPDADGTINAFIAVVTCNDAPDPFAEARHQLDAAAALGFDRLAAENAAWFARLYDQREDGRIFLGAAGTNATDNIPEIFSSWFIRHGGGNKPDMRRHESTASYANVEQDWQLWHSLPCYNEIFYTPSFVRHRADAADLWWKLVEAWQPAAEQNAREVYGATGLALVHGYLPPVKPDRYVHTNLACEFCIDTIAQMVKPLWDEWDYGGDAAFLRAQAYPALREAARFYASYAHRDDDGRYHFIPAIEAEAWGIFPEFFRGQDTISSLSMARWTFLRAAEAAELLHADSEERSQWLALAAKLAPYPTYETKGGVIFNSVPGTVPSHQQGDHGWYVGLYPTSLADEINLDSPEPLRAEMLRTASVVRTSQSREISVLLGAAPDTAERGGPPGRAPEPEALLNSRSGRIHLFPATAAADIVAFRHFQARGGFLVSAAKDATGVTFVEIEARRDTACQLMHPWPGAKAVVREVTHGATVPFTEDRANGDCLVFRARAGERYQVVRGD